MKLLVVEDSERLRRVLSHGLREIGYTVDLAENGEQALNLCQLNPYHAIVLDLMLPKVDGLSVLKHLRERGDNTSVLILSALDQVNDRIKGLNLGADDYLVKPFAFDELCARLKAISRRFYSAKNALVCIDRLCINMDNKQVHFAQQALHFTASEYTVLENLVLQRGRVLSKDQLFNYLYDMESGVSSNVIEVLVSSVRRKLKKAGAPDIIMTRRGFGYTVV